MIKAGTILFGMKAICNYTGYPRVRVEYAVKNERFPAAKTRGRWQSNSILVDEWQLRIMRQNVGPFEDIKPAV